MKQIRLLPVVIAAALALLVLKGFGIMSGGGYVLTGATSAQAAGGGETKPAEGSDIPALSAPTEPTMADENTVLDDGVPTLAVQKSAAKDNAGLGDEPGAEDGAHGAAEAPAGEAAALACPPAGGVGSEAGAPGAVTGCRADPGVNEAGDALPLIQDGAGNLVPLAQAGGVAPSEDAIAERLSERRQELDAMEDELDIRLALVEAAEQRIEERTAALMALEARINAMVDEKRTLEESQFVAVVAMYETMKPKDAAAIFDELEMPVLLRVARAVKPRKMAPIMAKMNPTKAMELTAGLAVDRVEPTIDLADGKDLAALPQIIGQ